MSRVALIAFALSVAVSNHAVTQETQFTERGPRFLLASAATESRVVCVDIARTPVLRRRVTLQYEALTLDEALKRLAESAGLQLAYSTAVIPANKIVSLKAQEITVAAALTELLIDADVDILFSTSGQAVVIRRSDAPKEVAPAVGTVSGRVGDAETTLPIAGAQVRVSGTNLGRVTDDSGRYAIVGVPAGDREIVARRVGYMSASQQVRVEDGATALADFSLTRVPTALSEVVTTATGGQRRLEVGNAISTIRVDSTVARAPVRDVGDLINGRAAGVLVMFPNGVAGQAPMLRIRGANSIIAGNDPIVIIDGIRMEATAARAPFDSRVRIQVPSTGRLADLNPEEIETLEIVKGPSASTLYGTDAANGVVVITTKRGRSGRTEWTAYGEQGFSAPDVSWPTNYYAWGRRTGTGTVQQCLLVAVAAGTCVRDSLTTFNPLRDAPNSPIGTGHRQQLGLQASGGASALRYFLAGELEDESGYLRLTSSEKQFLKNQRGGGEPPDWQVRPNTLLKGSLRANATAMLGPTADATVTAGFVRNGTLLPNAAILTNAMESARGTADTLTQWGLIGTRPAHAFVDRRKEDITRFTGGINANWRVNPWLTSRATLGVDFADDDFSYLVRRGDSPTVPLGRRLQQDQNFTLYTGDVGASALLGLGNDISTRTSVGAQYTRRTTYTTELVATGLAPGSDIVVGAATVSGFESGTQTVVVGSYVEEAFGYRERLFVTGALRLDGASSFGRDFRAALYPKIGVSWLAPTNAFVSRLRLGILRLRAAYGASGVQPNPIGALARDTLFTSVVNGVSTNGAALTAVENPELKPERQRELEGGVDIEGLDGRLRIEFTGYQRQSDDALINQPFAGSFGLGRSGVRQINIGEVRNRGVEGLFNARVFDRASLSWEIGINGNINQNKLIRLAPNIPRIGTGQIRQVPGYPVHSLWERPILSYTDANANGIIEPSELRVGDTAIFIGPMLPSRQASAVSTVGFFQDALRLNVLFDYRGGHTRWNGAAGNRCITFIGSCREIQDPSASLDRQAAAVALNNFGFDYTGYMEDGSYVKFREVSVSYTSTAVARLLRSRSAVLTAAGRNLATFTSYTGLDPEGTNNPGADGFSDSPYVYPGRYLIARVTLGY